MHHRQACLISFSLQNDENFLIAYNVADGFVSTSAFFIICSGGSAEKLVVYEVFNKSFLTRFSTHKHMLHSLRLLSP
jgi:hypothetical protein